MSTDCENRFPVVFPSCPLGRSLGASAQDLPAEVLGDGVHKHHVRRPPLAYHRAAADADAPEACALVCLLPSDAPVQCLDQHVTQLQDVEREVEHEPGDRGARAMPSRSPTAIPSSVRA